MADNSHVWDVPGQNFRIGTPSPSISNADYIKSSPYGRNSMISTPLGRVPVAPPPVPPRPSQTTYNSVYNSQGSYYNNFGLGGYPGFNTSSYGYGYRPGFSSFGYGYGPGGYYGANNPESRFIQLAEESSRPAFQSIQSILQAFSSVAMMFDSSFNALYSSYMSVLGVADNFGKLRSIFGHMFSALSIFRTLHWLCRFLMYKLGISKNNPEIETLWANAFNSAKGAKGQGRHKNSVPWSMISFLSIIMAGPYLLFKLMNHIFPNPLQALWNPIENPGPLALGMYDFSSSNDRELSFSSNQKLMIAPQQFQPTDYPGWLLACSENKKIGLVPNNYIGMLMQSEKKGKTYINYNGQKLEMGNGLLGESSKKDCIGREPSENITKMGMEVEENKEEKSSICES